MKTKKSLIVVVVFILNLLSCSKETIEDNNIVNDIEKVKFNSITASKTNAYLEDSITLTIDGSGYEEISVVSGETDNYKINILKIDDKNYQISATEELRATVIYVSLDGVMKNVKLNFLEHGVKNYNTIEGIQMGIDKTDLIVELLGEPEGKLDSSQANYEYWYYFSKGFYFYIDKTTKLPLHTRVYGDYQWKRTIENIEFEGKSYKYNFENSKSLTGPNAIKIDDVVDEFGKPDSVSTNPNNNYTHRFSYNKITTKYYFFSDSSDNYNNKTIPYVDIYK